MPYRELNVTCMFILKGILTTRDFGFIFLIFHISNLRMNDLKTRNKHLSEQHLTNVYSALQVEVSTMFYLGDLCSTYLRTYKSALC